MVHYRDGLRLVEVPAFAEVALSREHLAAVAVREALA